MKVVKFGGSSLANAEQIEKVVSIVQSDATRRVVVVSAPGKRFADDIKVTDLLIQIAETIFAQGDAQALVDQVIARYADIQQALSLPDSLMEQIRADLQDRLKTDSTNRAQFLDTMKAAGEDNNARLVAAAIRAAGTPALYTDPGEAGMLLSDEFGNAEVLPESMNDFPN